MAEVVVLRHGETAWSAAHRHTGRTDIPLTERGATVARAAGGLLTGRTFGLVLASPLQRAWRTAELAGLSPQPEPDLVEWDYGGYEGRTTEDISAELGRPWSLWRDGVVPGDTPGESVEAVADRLRRVLDRAGAVLAQGRDVVLVAHGHSLRVLTALWLELPPTAGALFRLDAGAIGVLGFEHDCHVLVGWNVTSRLA